MPSITELQTEKVTRITFSRYHKPVTEQINRAIYCELKAKHCRNMSKVAPLSEVREYYKGLEHFWLQHMDLAKRNM